MIISSQGLHWEIWMSTTTIRIATFHRSRYSPPPEEWNFFQYAVAASNLRTFLTSSESKRKYSRALAKRPGEMCLLLSPSLFIFSLVALIKVFVPESAATNQFEQIQSDYAHSYLGISHIPFFPRFAIPSGHTISFSCLDTLVILLFIGKFNPANISVAAALVSRIMRNACY